MFDAIADENEVITAENQARREQVARCKPTKRGRPAAAERARLAEERAKLAEMKPIRKTNGASTRQSIRRTLRAALNAAIARELITFNPAAHVELESGKRPKGLLWTEERVQRWRETGGKPSPVMVWTPEQLGIFLDHAEADRLYAFFHLVAFRGLRRGEAVGQDWVDVNLDAGLLTVSKEIVQDGWTPYESEPKTDGSAATIGLDSGTVAVLRAHRARQHRERLKWGEAWTDTGKVFTQEDGTWLHPETVSVAFRRIHKAARLPPINLRDLRHVAATLTHAGGGDLHTIKETLRHSTITLTSDTYTSLLPEVDMEVAEAAARLVPRQAGRTTSRTAGLTSGSHEGGNRGGNDRASRPVKPGRDAKLQVSGGTAGTADGGPSGARTLNQWIKSPLLCQLS
ncbi:Site-specific recombinase XerD [Streptomyces yunnanensis]|uniref:Site-specific recombinase XerD n=1 Tax=Streptomyces yunnanensis TaxID=156453 RepID=A0A9X8N0R0_9ACTN|nr:Site-specific recombinase XerD [Streptomyces yunnanensis]